MKTKLDIPQQHRKKIAISTLKMTDIGAVIMGGMTKQEAREFLSHSWLCFEIPRKSISYDKARATITKEQGTNK